MRYIYARGYAHVPYLLGHTALLIVLGPLPRDERSRGGLCALGNILLHRGAICQFSWHRLDIHVACLPVIVGRYVADAHLDQDDIRQHLRVEDGT